MRLERWYWLTIFLGISLAIHVGFVLLTRGAGGPGTGAKVSEIEVDLAPERDAVARRLPAPRRKRPSPSYPRTAALPQPFSAPPWQRHPLPPLAIRQPEPAVRGPQPAPPAASAGAATPWAGLMQGSPGSGQNGLVGMGAPHRVLRVSAGEYPVHQVTIRTSESAGSDPDRPPGSGDPAPRRRGELIFRARPQVQNSPPPVYPEEARAQHQQGTVYLRVAVTTEGRAESVDLLFSSGFPLLDEAAAAAVREWSFDPARNDTGPVSSRITVPVRFTLN